MKITKYSDPWEHFFVEEFLTEQELVYAKNLLEDFYPPQFKRKVEIIENELLKNKFLNLLNSVNIKVRDRYRIQLELNSIGKDYMYNIHTDLPSKIFSFILQLSDTGNGTNLYSKETIENNGGISNKGIRPDKTLPWLVNGGGAFFRGDYTYHSFDNIGHDNPRKSITFILFDDNF